MTVGRATALRIALLLALLPGTSYGGALDRFEKAHQPPEDSKESRGSSESSSSSSSSDDSDDDSDTYYDYDDDSSSGGGGGGNPAVALAFFCAIPPITFACFMPSHQPAREVYGTDELYVEPVGERSEDGVVSERRYLPEDEERKRWGELSVVGFRAFNEPVVYSHDIDVTGWLGMVLLNLSWEHYYEEIQETGEWDHLDVLGAHVGANVLGPFVSVLELYLFAGASVLHGDAWTPAFDVGVDARVYPVEPLAIHGSVTASVFAYGPILLDSRLDAGVVFGPLELRIGPRWLYQGDAQGFWGPTATLAGRF